MKKIVCCATDSEIRDENVVNHSNSCYCYSKHWSVKNCKCLEINNIKYIGTEYTRMNTDDPSALITGGKYERRLCHYNLVDVLGNQIYVYIYLFSLKGLNFLFVSFYCLKRAALIKPLCRRPCS